MWKGRVTDLSPQRHRSVYDFDEEDEEICEANIKRARKFNRLHLSPFSSARKRTTKSKSVGARYGSSRKKSLKFSCQGLKLNDLSPVREIIKSNLVDLTVDAEMELDSCIKHQSYIGASLESADASGVNAGCLAGKHKEVVVETEELFFTKACLGYPAWVTFTVDSVRLEVIDSRETCKTVAKTFQWDLNQISSFKSYVCSQAGYTFLELGVVCGSSCIAQQLGRSTAVGCNHGCNFFLKVKPDCWLEQCRQIIALGDHYNLLYKPMHEDKDHEKILDFRLRIIPLQQNISADEGPHASVKSSPSLPKKDKSFPAAKKPGFKDWVNIVYPREDPDAVIITKSDFLLLKPMEFLSDTLIDFYIKYLQSSLPEGYKRKLYFFNSFFFRKLAEQECIIQDEVEKRKTAFDGVKRWTAKVQIFEKDFLFIPVMQSAHWSLVIVCYPSPGLTVSGDNERPSMSCILHLDSLEGSHTNVEKPIKKLEDYLMEFKCDYELFSRDIAKLRETRKFAISWWTSFGNLTPMLRTLALRTLSQDCTSSAAERIWSICVDIHTKKRNSYLVEAWIDRYREYSDLLDYACHHISQMEFCVAKVPQQTNLSDCGLFLLHYAELFIKQINDFPHFLNRQWFNPVDASAKRGKIREMINGIAEKE